MWASFVRSTLSFNQFRPSCSRTSACFCDLSLSLVDFNGPNVSPTADLHSVNQAVSKLICAEIPTSQGNPVHSNGPKATVCRQSCHYDLVNSTYVTRDTLLFPLPIRLVYLKKRRHIPSLLLPPYHFSHLVPHLQSQ